MLEGDIVERSTVGALIVASATVVAGILQAVWAKKMKERKERQADAETNDASPKEKPARQSK